MDSAQIRTLVQTMSHQAEELRHIVSKSSAALESLEWAGRDRDRMLDTWRSQHLVSLMAAEQRLRDASQEAMRYAEAQERASR